MKPIPQSFKKYGHNFQQIARQDKVSLYRRTNDEGQVICYELILIEVSSERVLPSGKVKPAQEVYPASSHFGTKGWSLINKDESKALDRFRDLVKKVRQQVQADQPVILTTTTKAA